MFQYIKRYFPKTAIAAAGAVLLLNMGTASAGVSVLHPGAGNRPPKTPDWNVENSREENTLEQYKNQGEPIKRLDSKKGVSAITLKVMLGESLVSAAVAADTSYKLVDGNEGKTLASFAANVPVRISVDGGRMLINGEKINSRIVTVQTESSSARVKYNNAAYRGTLQLIYDGRGLQVINNLSLEDYVKGVLPSEMSSSWHPEVLKAQAVAARTFALYSKGKEHSASSGYDLCSSTHCQVYSGVAAETENANRAVDATYGQVMYYDNKVIYAAFHSSSGGATENSEDVWGNYLPYLRSVTDDDSRSPYHNWTERFTVPQVQKKLEASGKGVGTLQSMELTASSGTSITGRSASGRAYGIKFTGSSGSAVLTGEQLRVIFGLKSSMFNVRTERTVPLTGGSGQKAEGKRSSNGVTAAPAAMRGSAMKISGSETVAFDGHGFGHGLGMAQYGAKAMAEKGSRYDAVLKHYYTDIVIQEIY